MGADWDLGNVEAGVVALHPLSGIHCVVDSGALGVLVSIMANIYFFGSFCC